MTLNLIQKIRKQLKAVKSKVRKRVVKKNITSATSARKGPVKTSTTKVKIKYNKDGSIKKTVSRRGGKRRVVKKKRDSRKTTLNAIRNLRDEKREKKYTKERRRKPTSSSRAVQKVNIKPKYGQHF
tara:strand:+ start:11735 stop:12112 length:378 start_codon:yes stop_codon:yes gene_type:complete